MLRRLGRREFCAAVAAFHSQDRKSQWSLGVMDGVVRQVANPKAMAEAARFGFQGVQVTIPRPIAGSNRSLLEEDKVRIAELSEAAKSNGITINSTYLEVLHVHCLKSDSEAKEWVRRGITMTRALGAPILMTVFFGKCAIQNSTERNAVSAAFKELIPVAKDSGIVLGFENLLNAEDSARVLDEVGSDWLRVYYDVGNAANQVGVDPAREIRWLGKERICQLHFKDKGYLGEGKVNYEQVFSALSAIGYSGWANLETSAPSGDFESDLRRNVQYLQQLSARTAG